MSSLHLLEFTPQSVKNRQLGVKKNAQKLCIIVYEPRQVADKANKSLIATEAVTRGC